MGLIPTSRDFLKSEQENEKQCWVRHRVRMQEMLAERERASDPHLFPQLQETEQNHAMHLISVTTQGCPSPEDAQITPAAFFRFFL